MARILVADTDQSVRDLVRRRLTAWGHEVVSLADGQSALHAWHEAPFDLTLVDMVLPRVPGLDVLRAIRALDSAEHATVVVMCDPERRNDAALAYGLGADEVVHKPVTLGFLTSFASSLLADGAGSRREAVPA